MQTPRKTSHGCSYKVAITSITGKGLRRFPDIHSDGFDVLWDMAILIPLLVLAAAAQTVKVDQFPLRAGCGESDPVVARLHAGDPVQIKFSLAGEKQPCYVVSATVDGKVVDGNLPADALTGLEEFDRSRRNAAPVIASAEAPKAATPAPLPAAKSSSPEMDQIGR